MSLISRDSSSIENARYKMYLLGENVRTDVMLPRRFDYNDCVTFSAIYLLLL